METTETQDVVKSDADHYFTKMQELADEAGIKLTMDHIMTFAAIFVEKRNVLITGGAGVGKTTFVKTVVMPMLDHLGLRYGITATTGIAGSHLDGKTLHSWMGFGLGIGPILQDMRRNAVDLSPSELEGVYEQGLEEWYSNPKMQEFRKGIMARLNNTDVLLIDEISMCNGMSLFGYTDYFLRKIRGEDHKPFGGMRLILMGDFAQLPPVDTIDGRRTDWAFMCPSWREADIKVCNLTEVFRQEDKVFATFLNRRRLGVPMTVEEHEYMRAFVKHQTTDEVARASFLVATNNEADDLNDRALTWYPGDVTKLHMLYHIRQDRLKRWENIEKVRKELFKSVSVVKEVLKFKPGIPVLFTVNNPDAGYVNGTKGFVHEIIPDASSRANTFLDDTKVVVRVPGKNGAADQLIPVSRRLNTRNRHEDPSMMDYDNLPYYPAMRQFPLIPATAITVHKSQGMSLDECTVDLSRSFAPGHVYVALSRLRTAEGLTLASDNFTVLVDPDVVDFYRKHT